MSEATANETAAETGSETDLQGLAAEFLQEPLEAEDLPPAPENEPPEGDEAPEGAEEPEAPESVEGRYGLGDMPEEDRRELMKEWGTRGGERINQLTAKLREAEGQISALQQEARKSGAEREVIKSNPLKGKSLEEVEATYDNALAVIEKAEDLLDEADNFDPSDEIGEIGDKPVTKAEARRALREARRYVDRFVPDQRKALKAVQRFEDERKQTLQAVESEYSWMTEDGPMKAEFDRMAPRVAALARNHDPELLPYVDVMLADHLSNAVERMRKAQGEQKGAPEEKPKQEPKKVVRKPLSTAPGGAAGAGRAATRKGSEEAEKAFMEREQSTEADLAALFARQSAGNAIKYL